MKKLIFISLLLWGAGALQAQEKEKSQALYFNIGSGLHNLKYDLKNGTQQNSMGYTLNLGYNYFFSKNLGFGTGLGLESFNSKATLNYQTSKNSVDTDGESFEFRTQYTDWQEKQSILLLDIPLSFICQKQINEQFKFQFSVGPKVSFAIQSNYKIEGGQIETTGYYPQYNVVLYGMPQHNFTTLTSFPKNDIKLNPVVSVYSDLGGLYKLNNCMDLYAGVYIDYGLTNMIDAQNKLLYQEDGVYNGVFSSDLTNKIKQFAFGFKIGINFRLSANEALSTDDMH
jgi:OmpA-OmpF porin, OOP family